MNLLMPLILSLFITLQSFAAAETEPRYSDFKKLSNAEVQQKLEKYIGKNDTWKKNIPLLSRAKKIIPFQKKTTVEEERILLSYAYAKKSPVALQEYVLTAYNSSHPEVRGTIGIVRGDKRLVYNSFTAIPNYNLRALLFFFTAIEMGDTGLETKKFHEYALAFDYLSQQVSRAYQAAVELNMPLILEFESSAISSSSPLTRMFYNYLVKDPAKVLKANVTPDGGRIIAIHTFYAKDVVENLNLFVNQFELKVNTLRNRIFTDPEAKQRLLDLLRNGEGLSGILYTDERIQELSIQAKAKITGGRICNRLF